MAVAGIPVLVAPGMLETLREGVLSVPGVSVHGVQANEAGEFLILVVERPSRELESCLEAIASLPGALSVYAASVSVEDELEQAGGAR